jgi:hypothetical protein
MSDAAPPATPARRLSSWPTIAAIVLLALYAAMSFRASLHKGPSFDEAEELAVGYDIWVHHDFRMEGANGDLIKRWATLPYLITHPNPATTGNDYWRGAKAYRYGFEFFYQSGNKPEWLLLQGRAMVLLIGIATGALIFWCARELFGALGGLFALGLFTFSPHMLAFGSIVSTDMSACLTTLGSTWCIWRLLHRVTWARLIASVVLLGLLGLAKPTVMVIFPVAAILVLVKLWKGKPLEWRLGRARMITSRKAQAGICAGLVLIHALGSWAMLWAHYDFRYAASPRPDDASVIFRVPPVSDPIDPTVAALMDWVGQKHLLPEGFLQGMHALLVSNDWRQSFLDGHWRIGGWTVFFPYTIFAKTSPALFLLIILGFTGWFLARRQGFLPPGNHRPATVPPFYDGAPYFTLAVVYLASAMVQAVDIGHRHILPVYPLMYILGGGAMALLWPMAKTLTRLMTVALLLWFAGESFMLYPDYLAYFSPLVGGPTQGYQHLIDSSLDWGMDLPKLHDWLEENNPGNATPVYLAYFGTDSPDYYGIRYNALPFYPDWRPHIPFGYGPGLYVISATLYESVYTLTFGPWNTQFEQKYQLCLREMETYEKAETDPALHTQLLNLHPQKYWDDEFGWFERLRFARLTAWLRHHKPPLANVGYSILIWRLDLNDLQAALLGPPPEINDDPLAHE